MVIGQNDSQFLRQQAANLRVLAERCTVAIRAELIALAQELEQRADVVEKKDSN
jgi:hypothetical protein